MDTVRRNEQIPSINSNDKLRTDSLLKQKMCSSKKHSHTPMNSVLPSESLRSQSFSLATNMNHQPSTNRHHYQNGDFSLQKPRVYTHDDRPFLGHHQQNILSSSSASSTLSVKDKSLKEVGETRYNLFSQYILYYIICSIRISISMCFASRFFSITYSIHSFTRSFFFIEGHMRCKMVVILSVVPVV